MQVIRHFLPDLPALLRALPDPRHAQRCTYSLTRLLWSELMMLLGGVGSRHAMQDESADCQFAQALDRLAGEPHSGLPAPHPDTPYVFLQTLPPEALAAILPVLFRRLLKQRCFDDFRYHGHWLIAIDATWVRAFKRPHCPHCLHQRHADGSITYMHPVLEAKVILSNGMVLPLLSMAIANEDPAASKQNCELSAFRRLAEQLKKEFPRLPICLVMDALYCCGPVLQTCEANDWSYIIVCKPGNSPKLYEAAKTVAWASRAATMYPNNGLCQVFRWATHLPYQDHHLHAVFCEETRPATTTPKKGQPSPPGTSASPSQWAWVSNLRPDHRWAPIIANEGGRQRWQIEENFHALKHGPVKQRHNFGSKGQAWHNTWVLATLANFILQLISHSDAIRSHSGGVYRRFTQAYASVKQFTCRLRESFRRDAKQLAEEGWVAPMGIQIRFDSS